MSKRTFCLALGLLTFFMSSILDNLTTTLVIVTLLRRFIGDREDRLLVGGLVVIAANAGGAWTPIGDVTTTMLWIRGHITSWQTMKSLFLPSFAAFLVAVAWLSYGMKGSFTKPGEKLGEELPFSAAVTPTDVGGKWILLLGTLIFVLVPVFKMWTHLPAYMGLLVGLALLWVITDRMHSGKERPRLHVQHALSRIDSSSLLFFLGILLAIGALEHSLLLRATAEGLDHWIGSKWVIAALIGLVSAVVDNVPLVAATMSMYSVTDFGPDHPLWQWIAYCAGTGGSILIIGSAAGIAFMGLEKVSFIWYAKRVGICALVSYAVGIGCLALMGVLP